MDKPIRKKNDAPDKDCFYDALVETDSVVCATECTGLMHRPPQNEAESESYNEIYKMRER